MAAGVATATACRAAVAEAARGSRGVCAGVRVRVRARARVRGRRVCVSA